MCACFYHTTPAYGSAREKLLNCNPPVCNNKTDPPKFSL